MCRRLRAPKDRQPQDANGTDVARNGSIERAVHDVGEPATECILWGIVKAGGHPWQSGPESLWGSRSAHVRSRRLLRVAPLPATARKSSSRIGAWECGYNRATRLNERH